MKGMPAGKRSERAGGGGPPEAGGDASSAVVAAWLLIGGAHLTGSLPRSITLRGVGSARIVVRSPDRDPRRGARGVGDRPRTGPRVRALQSRQRRARGSRGASRGAGARGAAG